tara:strand:- start:784 stop:1176 length:393 start_codon:yes stop_codon:yes gene_type:complete
MRIYKECLYCDKELNGRTDKKFCDPQCKSGYQYQNEKQNPKRFYNKVDNQLKLNRKILKEYNKGGKVTVRTKALNDLGFNPNFFTHYWKNSRGDTYLFVYEYGFLKKTENNVEKYILVQWQDYMNQDYIN